MSRSRLAACLLVLAASIAAPVTSGASSHDWTGEPTLLGGTSRYDAGEWIYSDFVYDDYGANTAPGGQPQVVSLAATSGDFRYPNGTTEAGNAADIVEVRTRITAGDDLEVRVTLQSLVDPSLVALEVTTGATSRVITQADAAIDAAANTVSFTLADAAGGDAVELFIGAGLHDGAGELRAGQPGSATQNPGEFTTGAPTDARLFDLAFNTREIEGRGGAWNEDVQSAALASGALDPFAQTIDVATLLAGTTTPVPSAPGYYVRLFESRQDLGEGMRSSFPQYRGRWQPYALWIPEGYDGEAQVPLFLNLHSLSVHHNQYRGGPSPSASYKTLYEQFDDALGAIVVTPLARGPDGWYWDEGLIDTLEVWADAIAHYATDAERTYVGGYSMGGYGTYRLTTLMPDAFASAISIVGPPANGIWPWPLPPTGGEDNPNNTQPQLPSTRHVPIWITQGVLDELVPFLGVVNHSLRFAELGHEYRFALHPLEDHLSFVFKDDWSRESSWLASHATRVLDPRRVTLRIRPASWAGDGDPVILGHLAALVDEIDTRVDGAYWVDEVAVAPGDDVTGSIDLTSGAIAGEQTGVTPIMGPGIDGPSPYVLTGQDRVMGSAATSDTLSGTLSNVTALTVDVGRAGLSDSPIVSVSSDVPATITFVRGGAAVGTAIVGP